MDEIIDSSGEKTPTPFAQTYFHGTKVALKIGDLIKARFSSNYGRRKMRNTFFSRPPSMLQSGVRNFPAAKVPEEFTW